jgi:predicted O-methyltransferase YrrM
MPERRLIGALLGDRALRRLRSIPFRSGLGDSAWILYGLVRAMKPETCVEIGSARGMSTCHIGLALRENGAGRLYAIDPHRRTEWNDVDSIDTYATIARNLRRLHLSRQVEILKEESAAVATRWDRPIDLLFIDGDHSYEGVRRDWEGFARFVRPFGLVVFHDTLWDLRPDPRYARADMGVPCFVEELRATGYPVITLERNYGVSLVQPTRHGSPLRPPSS